MAIHRKHMRFGFRGSRCESGAMKRLLRALDELRAQRLSRGVVVRGRGLVVLPSNVMPLPAREDVREVAGHRRWARRLLARSAAAAMLCMGLGTGLGACDLGGSDGGKDVVHVEDVADTVMQEIAPDLGHDLKEEDMAGREDLMIDLVPTDLEPEDEWADTGLDQEDANEPEDVADLTDTEEPDVEPGDVLPDVGPDVPPGGECWSDADCLAEQHCEGAVICSDGAFCILPNSPGTCVDDEAPAECVTDADCPEGQECVTLGGCPEGMYCILPVEPVTMCLDKARECYVDEQCPDGWECVGATYCPDGAICILPSSPGVCEEIPQQCYTDADCDVGETCVGATTCPEGMFCILPNQPGECQVTAAQQCYSDADCDVGETCVGGFVCPEGAMCILPNQPGECQDAPMAILPPSPTIPKPGASQESKSWDAFMKRAEEVFGKKR